MKRLLAFALGMCVVTGAHAVNARVQLERVLRDVHYSTVRECPKMYDAGTKTQDLREMQGHATTMTEKYMRNWQYQYPKAYAEIAHDIFWEEIYDCVKQGSLGRPMPYRY